MSRRVVRYVASTYTYLWRRDLVEAIEDLATAGFAAVEVLAAAPHVSLPTNESETRQFRQACGARGVGVNSVVPSGIDVNLASTDHAMRAWSTGQFVAATKLAAELSASYVMVHPGRRHPLRPPPTSVMREWVLEAIGQVAEAGREAGVDVLIENTPTGLFDTAEECANLVREVGSERLGLCYDVANAYMVEDVRSGLRSASPYLQLVHASDTNAAVWAHDPIGTGELDFVGIGAELGTLDYHGPVVVETLHHDDSPHGFMRDVARLQSAGWGAPEDGPVATVFETQ